MKAIIHTQYGLPDAPGVLQFKEVEKPRPQDHQLLINVRAASINALDGHLVKNTPALMRILVGNGLLKPKEQKLGVDIAGRVEAVGNNVTQFQPGDEVFGGCAGGGFAEYVCADEKMLAPKSANLSFETVAAVPVAALAALQGLRDHGQIKAGQQVLIHGASGGVGTFAVQIARAFGAVVTAVCSTKNMDLMRSLGADQVIDYTQEDVTRKDQLYDLILAVNGYHSLFAYRRILRPRGAFVLVGASKAHLFKAMIQAMLLGPLLARKREQKMGFMGIAIVNRKDLMFVQELLDSGQVVPVIDKCYPLSETARAFRYVEEEHVRGKIVITID